MEWYTAVLRKYAEFDGRARRKEYWMFTLFNIIIYIALSIVDQVAGLNKLTGGISPLATLYSLGVLIPGLAVSVRRLHDTNKSGWWILIAFIPLIGAIVLLVFMVTDGDRGKNRFGRDPKASARSADDDDDRDRDNQTW